MTVVEVDGSGEHELPADTVTWDDARASAPLVPLGFRPRRARFFVRSGRWPGLAGRALRLKDSAD
jgi:hypothetical protein